MVNFNNFKMHPLKKWTLKYSKSKYLMPGILIEKISTTSETGAPVSCNLWLEIGKFAFLLHHAFENKATKKKSLCILWGFFMDIFATVNFS